MMVFIVAIVVNVAFGGYIIVIYKQRIRIIYCEKKKRKRSKIRKKDRMIP